MSYKDIISYKIELAYEQINEKFLNTTLKYFCCLPYYFGRYAHHDMYWNEKEKMDFDTYRDYCDLHIVHPVVFEKNVDIFIHKLFKQYYEYSYDDYEWGEHIYNLREFRYDEEEKEKDFQARLRNSAVVLFFICLFPWTKDNVKKYKIFNNLDIESLYEPVLKDGLDEDYSYRIKMNYLKHFVTILMKHNIMSYDPLKLALEKLRFYNSGDTDDCYGYYSREYVYEYNIVETVHKQMFTDILNALILTEPIKKSTFKIKDELYDEDYKYDRLQQISKKIVYKKNDCDKHGIIPYFKENSVFTFIDNLQEKYQKEVKRVLEANIINL